MKLILSQENLDKLHTLVHDIANDYVELSYEKVIWQRDDYIKTARDVLKSLEWDDE